MVPQTDYLKYTNGKQYTNSLSVSNNLRESSQVISIDESKINTDVSTAVSLSYSEGVEHQVYIVLDMDNACITSIIGHPGKNDSAPIEADEAFSMPKTYYIEGSEGLILIGEVHGHPQSNSGKTLSMTSPEDAASSKAFGIPIYAVDAMSYSSEGNMIHRVVPSGQAITKIGRTIGRNSPGYSFGSESLRIWGQSHYYGNPIIPYPKRL